MRRRRNSAARRACITAIEQLPGGRFDRLAACAPSQQQRPSVRLYGSRLDGVMALTSTAGTRHGAAPTGDIGAQVLFAMREEMALTLEDA